MRRRRTTSTLYTSAIGLSIRCAVAALYFPIVSGWTTSLVTGSTGFVGRAVIQQLIFQQDRQQKADDPHKMQGQIFCFVRPTRVEAEEQYWFEFLQQKQIDPSIIRVLPYDMLDGGTSLRNALEMVQSENCCIYHIASVFGPTENHKQTALDNVRGTEDLIRTLASMQSHRRSDPSTKRLILMSSMAAVRATGQVPLNGHYYTNEDWNNLSQLGTNWGSSYQWSKAESERLAWNLSQELRVPMASLCPSFVFGPPVLSSSSSYSLTLVRQWAKGESPVQSRLFVDVRDLAKASIEAGRRPEVIGKRILVSTDARVSSREIADWLKEVPLADPDKIHFDAAFTGGAIRVGQKEVDAQETLRSLLGVDLRPVRSTIMDMAEVLLKQSTFEN